MRRQLVLIALIADLDRLSACSARRGRSASSTTSRATCPRSSRCSRANLTQTSRILDRNGNLIEALYHQNRTVVPLSKISINLQQATIDTEDRSFYSNSGVDYRRLAIAIAYDLTHHSSTLGGSTITQQVVKNDVLDTHEAQSKTDQPQVPRARCSRRRWSVATRSSRSSSSTSTPSTTATARTERRPRRETYFQVHASDLTWAQASFLAGLPQAPADYDPFGTPDQLAAAKWRWRDGAGRDGVGGRPHDVRRGRAFTAAT